MKWDKAQHVAPVLGGRVIVNYQSIRRNCETGRVFYWDITGLILHCAKWSRVASSDAKPWRFWNLL